MCEGFIQVAGIIGRRLWYWVAVVVGGDFREILRKIFNLAFLSQNVCATFESLSPEREHVERGEHWVLIQQHHMYSTQ